MSAEMAVSQRMVKLLSLIRAGVTNSGDLRGRIADYEGESGDRLYRMDLRALRSRGLVRTGIVTPQTPRGEGVRAVELSKPQAFVLSEEEHSALQAARDRFRDEQPMAPSTDGRDGRAAPLDLAMDAIRILEEKRDWVTIQNLATELSARPEVLIRALRDMPDDDNLTLLIDEFDEVTDEPLDSAEIRVYVERPSLWGDGALRSVGIGQFGRFAYTEAETGDRLQLIERGLADPELANLHGHLSTAQRKLERWARHLANAMDT